MSLYFECTERSYKIYGRRCNLRNTKFQCVWEKNFFCIFVGRFLPQNISHTSILMSSKKSKNYFLSFNSNRVWIISFSEIQLFWNYLQSSNLLYFKVVFRNIFYILISKDLAKNLTNCSFVCRYALHLHNIIIYLRVPTFWYK